ncbi:uncharacterized protein LOC116216846 [Meleagris gallopavo]|uniref:uncharacterized protein LOC116216846 n=1 Tax=Meleagris gallopavo TaxID=9103 RepID=UPI0012AC48B6|nr:uncharacterized protein LOC116216846 [Meleagris gallopavo]
MAGQDDLEVFSTLQHSADCIIEPGLDLAIVSSLFQLLYARVSCRAGFCWAVPGSTGLAFPGAVPLRRSSALLRRAEFSCCFFFCPIPLKVVVLFTLEASEDFGRLALSSQLFRCTAYRHSLRNLSAARKLLTFLSCFAKAEGSFPRRAEPRFPLARTEQTAQRPAGSRAVGLRAARRSARPQAGKDGEGKGRAGLPAGLGRSPKKRACPRAVGLQHGRRIARSCGRTDRAETLKCPGFSLLLNTVKAGGVRVPKKQEAIPAGRNAGHKGRDKTRY